MKRAVPFFSIRFCRNLFTADEEWRESLTAVSVKNLSGKESAGKPHMSLPQRSVTLDRSGTRADLCGFVPVKVSSLRFARAEPGKEHFFKKNKKRF